MRRGERVRDPGPRMGPGLMKKLYGPFQRMAFRPLEKFNPWHDDQGRFTSPDAALASGPVADSFFAAIGARGSAKDWKKVAGDQITPDGVRANLENLRGLGVAVGKVRITTDEGTVTISGTLTSERVGRMGVFARTLSRDREGKIVVEHTNFEVDPSFKGRGTAAIVNDRLETIYREMGVDRIELSAGFDGKVAWPKQGYDFVREQDRKEAQVALARIVAVQSAKQGREADLVPVLARPLSAWEIARYTLDGVKTGEEALRSLPFTVRMVKKLSPKGTSSEALSEGERLGRSYMMGKKMEAARQRGPLPPQKVGRLRKEQQPRANQDEVAMAELRSMEAGVDAEIDRLAKKKGLRLHWRTEDFPKLKKPAR